MFGGGGTLAKVGKAGEWGITDIEYVVFDRMWGMACCEEKTDAERINSRSDHLLNSSMPSKTISQHIPHQFSPNFYFS